MLTEDKTVVIGRLKNNNGMAIDTVEMKIYFTNCNSISRANLDGTGFEVFLQNADVYKMTIDWIGRRLFWTRTIYPRERIFVVYLDGKGRRAVIRTSALKKDITVDPTVG